MDQRRVSQHLKLLAGAIALAGFLYVGRFYWSEIGRLRGARPLGVAGMVLIHGCILYLQGMTLRLGLARFDNRITGVEGLALSTVGSYANLLIPRSGIATTAAFLKHKCGTPLLDFSSIVLFNAALFVCCSSLVGTAALGAAWTLGAPPAPWMLIALPLATAVSFFAVSVKWRVPCGYNGPASSLLRRFCRASEQLASSRSMWALAAINLTLTLARAARLYVAFWTLSIDVSPLGVLLASALGDLVFIFAITPAALGFREAAITCSAGAMGTSTALALSVAVFDRLTFSVTVIVLAQIFISYFVSLGGRTKQRGSDVAASSGGALVSSATPSSSNYS